MKRINVICLICFCFILASCSTTVGESDVNVTQNSTIDNNADNINEITTIKTVDTEDEETIKNNETKVDLSKFKVTDQDDSESSIFAGITVNEGKQYRKFFFNKFSGVRTIGKYSKKITIDYKSSVESGKLNVIILDSNYSIIKVLETNENESISLDFAETDEYIIRAVGDDARNGYVEIQVK